MKHIEKADSNIRLFLFAELSYWLEPSTNSFWLSNDLIPHNFFGELNSVGHKHFCWRGSENGATCRDRTDDLMITNQLLYQLS